MSTVMPAVRVIFVGNPGHFSAISNFTLEDRDERFKITQDRIVEKITFGQPVRDLRNARKLVMP